MWPEYFISLNKYDLFYWCFKRCTLHYRMGLGCWHMDPNESLLTFLGRFFKGVAPRWGSRQVPSHQMRPKSIAKVILIVLKNSEGKILKLHLMNPIEG